MLGRNDATPINTGKMDNNVAGIGAAEGTPGVTFVGQSAIKLDGKASLCKGALNAIEFSEILFDQSAGLGRKREK